MNFDCDSKGAIENDLSWCHTTINPDDISEDGRGKEAMTAFEKFLQETKWDSLTNEEVIKKLQSHKNEKEGCLFEISSYGKLKYKCLL